MDCWTFGFARPVITRKESMATTLAEKYAALSNTAPILQDPEEDTNLDTVARVTDKYEEDDSDLYFGASQLKQRATNLLADDDVRYSGRKISRKSLQDDGDDDDDDDLDMETGESGDSSWTDEEDEDIAGYTALLASKQKQGGRNSAESEDESPENEQLEDTDNDDNTKDVDDDNDNENDFEEEEEDDEDDDENMLTLAPEKDMIQKFSHINIDQETEKGKAVQAQLGLWDHLLECRIKMQKMLSLSNCLPQPDTWPIFIQQGGNDYQHIVSRNAKAVKKVLEKLLSIQEKLVEMNPETSQIFEGKQGKVPESSLSDEEIPSDTDEEIQDSADVPGSATSNKSGSRKRKLQDKDIPALLEKRHSSFLLYRNSTIQKWNDKTRLASGKMGQKSFAAFEQSAVKQIEQICNDRDRLRKRTQLKRSSYRVLGKDYTQTDEQEEKTEFLEDRTRVQNKSTKNYHLKDYDPEIFDDDDFYHQLLRELIERKTADTKDPVAISRQWLEIQKLRSKIKKKVDTKASKGRKIRFDVHPKLINFMAPIDHHEMTNEAKDELFRSLFGNQRYSTS